MSSITYFSRREDYLGNLGARLRDLQGYATLAYELIQNADDARANWMSFDIGQSALMVDNDGVFSDCRNVEDDECPWSSDGSHNYKCDFHRFRLLNSGDKRFQEGTTGAFGIGFISVYQLTDRPELISAGRHWKLCEEESEDKRIAACPGCSECEMPGLPGTRFIFSFARDEGSPLRQKLKADPVPEDVVARLMEELEHSLPVAMLFLKNLRTIEVKEGGVPRRKFEREEDGNTVIISQGSSESDRIWQLIRGDFQSEAAGLRLRHPGIEETRSSDVMVALPDELLNDGLLCACLPTEESPGLPFHVNADFFTSNDRKRVILGDDYQSRWNRKALMAAAGAIAEATPRLTKMLGAELFWHVVSALYALNLNSKGKVDPVWKEFWNAMEIVLRREEVVLTSSGEWTTTSSGVTILQRSEEANYIHVLQELGIDLVSEKLRRYQKILRAIGVPLFGIEALCSALISNGLDRPVSLDEIVPCLKSDSGRAALWAEINILLHRQEKNPRGKDTDKERLRTISLAPTVDQTLRPCKDTFRADSPASVQLFRSLGLDIPFLDDEDAAFEPLSYLCNAFEADNAVEALEKAGPVAIQQQLTEDTSPISELIEWFANRREQIFRKEETRRKLANLSIYPSASQLRPLTELALPGDFVDPLGIARLVDMELLGNRRELLLELGVNELNFRTYALEYLSQALEDEALDPADRNEALTLLAERLGTLKEDEEVYQKLSSVRLVVCTDGKYRYADECYFPIDTVQEVLGTNAFFADQLDERETSVRELFEWLGVASVPRLRDIVKEVRRIVNEPCSIATVDSIRRVVDHLGGRFESFKNSPELDRLKFIAWLPARGDTNQWHRPEALYAPYRSYLFDSQARVLDVSTRYNRGFLEHLGVQIDPSPALVVRHLLYCVEREEPVNMEVYRFLNENVEDPAIHKLKSTRCLWLGKAYWSPDDVFWGDHPFGKFRRRLGDTLRSYGPLLEKLGVARSPNHEDTLRVLREISSQFGNANRTLDEQEYSVLMNCWQMCEKYLDQGIISRERLENLSKFKCIPNKDKKLFLPTLLFFDNRAGLASRFGKYLSESVISRPLEAGRAFQAAGVRQLGSVVAIELLRNENPIDDHNVQELLRQRRNEIARVLSCQMDSHDVNNALDRLNHLKCKSATSLVIKYRFDVFRPVKESDPEHAPALYQPDSLSLWTTYPNGRPPWAPLARELAIALFPEEDPGRFSSGLKDALAADTTVEAANVLNELGFAQLDTADIVAPPSPEAAQQLGIDDLANNEEFPLPHSDDESQPDRSPKGTTENLLTEDAMPKSDIMQDQVMLDPEAPKQASAGGEGRSRTNAQPQDPAIRPNQHGTDTRREKRAGGRREFNSYVAVRADDESESDPDGLSREKRMNLEEKAIKLILQREPELERTPKNNPGFDLTLPGPDGQPVKWVEVKSMTGTLDDHPVTLTPTQFEHAQKLAKAYWLYIVEKATNPEYSQIIKIRDPAGKARRFTFDHGWKEVSEVEAR